ncbi:hypothetical protein L1987_02996 [Smallanthus sonchifolius]|uniref:Uncharacterized protein n=1 Tax=Smallanthus sonchifolius TaxID=185202 RepID=A0ACB9K9C3_9ASTR|nr:hypothetical protein L1987_02996 [Smallanthus sonchifolius]
MHACNCRHLGLFHKESGNEFRLTSKNTPEIMAEHQGRNFNEDNIEQKESKLEFLLVEQKIREGSNVVQINKGETKLEGWGNHARSTMESKNEESAINNSKDNSVSEDVVVMDYAQPHRKPPIHNLEP